MAKFFSIAATTVVLGTAIYAAAGYVGIPYVVRLALERNVSHTLNRQILIDDVTFNPWNWLLEIKGLRIASLAPNTPPMLSIPLLRVDIAGESVRHLAPVLDEITVDQLQAEISLNDPDIRQLLDKKASSSTTVATGSNQTSNAIPDFALYNISINNANVHLSDKANGLDQSITEFNLSLPFVSTLPGAKESLVTPTLNFNLNGSPVYATGTTKPFGTTLEARLNFRISELDIAPLAKLVPTLNRPALQLQSGRLSTDMSFIFRNPTGGKPGRMMLNGTAQLKNLSATQTTGNKTTDFFRIAHSSVKIKQVDLMDKTAVIDSIAFDRVSVTLPTNKETDTTRNSTPEASQTASTETATAESSWVWSLGELSLSNAQVDIVNPELRRQPKISLTDLTARIEGLSSNPDAAPATFKASAGLLGGKINAQGQIGSHTFDGNIALNVDKIDLSQASAFLQGFVKGSVSGQANANLNIVLNRAQPSLKGTIGLDTVALKQGRSSTPIAFDALRLKVKAIDLAKQQVQLDSLVLKQPNLLVTQSRSGLNLSSILVSSAKSSAASGTANAASQGQSGQPPESTPWSWQLGAFQIVNGQVKYSDISTRPTLGLTLNNINVKTGLIGSHVNAPTPFEVSSLLNKGEIHFKGNYTLGTSKVDAETLIRNLDLKEISPLFQRKTNFAIRSANLNAKGQLSAQSQSHDNWAISWTGESALNNILLTTAKGSKVASWNALALSGIVLNTTGTSPDLRIAKLTLDQPTTQTRNTVRELGNLASLLAKATGHEKTAERINKAQGYIEKSIVLEDIRYEKGQFSVKGNGTDELTAKLLERIGTSLLK